MEMFWVPRDTPEWTAMWNALQSEVGSIETPDAQSGEYWQYMGSAKDPDGAVHEFRHRSLNGERVYRRVTTN